MSMDADATQLSKLKLCVSGSNDISQKTFGTVTPPPSPLEVHGDIDFRPPHSYVRIVIMALLDCAGHEATIREIYDMITQKFPYYQENRLHWKNSVRHNLTVFSCFQRITTEEGSSSRGSNRWRLVGDWRSILEKAEGVPVRKCRPCSPSIVDKFVKKKKKHQKPSRGDKLEIGSKRDKDLAKRKKREKARKMRLAAGIRRIDRMPSANFNYHDFTSPISPIREEQTPPRMSTPPPRLPGIENIFLPSPTPSVSPLREPLNIWDDSPDDLNLFSIPNLSLIDEITDIISANDVVKVPHLTAQRDALEVISKFEADIDAGIERQSSWHQFTPEQSPTKAWSELSMAGLNGYALSSKSKNLWDLLDSTVNPEVVDLFTLNSEWSSSMTTDDYLLVS